MRGRSQVLVVDDEAAMRDACLGALSGQGLSVHQAASSVQALEMLSRRSFQLVLLDLTVPDGDGLELLRTIRMRHSHTAVIVICASPSVPTAVEAMKCGATDFLPKPFARERLRSTVRKALTCGALRRGEPCPERSPTQTFEPPMIIGRSARMKEVFGLIARVAPTDSTVLVMGASGTGKELVARALHHGSRRADGPFVVVDCGTLVGTLFENELFGHVKGSFTGASTTTHGRFELADGGTILLDEVGCLETGMQQKLLRVLEQREFTRVGSSRTISVDVRVIAATNSDLAGSVADGTFREDLYYRLSVFPIVLPPLHERKEDIPALAEHFLRLHCMERQKDIEGFHPDVLPALMAHDWPGNVRELSNAIERAVVLAEEAQILCEHLLRYGTTQAAAAQPEPCRPMTLAELERVHIEHVLRQTDGNKSLTADMLGVDRKTLWRKLRQYEESEQ